MRKYLKNRLRKEEVDRKLDIDFTHTFIILLSLIFTAMVAVGVIALFSDFYK